DGTPCARLVVPAGKEHPISGRLSMVDVLVGPASPWDYLLHRVHLLKTFRDGSQLVPASDVLGNTPAGQLACQDTQQMTGSTEDASVSALSRLGYSVKSSNLGAQVNLVQPGSAAAAAGVKCNDVVTAVDGRPIATAADLKVAITAQKPGAAVGVTVRRTGGDGKVATRTLTATLTGTPALPASPGGAGVPAAPDQAFLGVGSRTQTTYTLPFDVSIQVGDIGGPSAGLALTLGLLDVLSNGNLTGGLHVAATGTISPDGTVGAVGGVAQKAVAVRRAGVQIFLVPADNVAEARSEAGTHLRVMAVSSLQQALTDLERAGGHLGPLVRQPAATAAPATGG
ncbi:MAG: PDZ domain-containing protein, partial [Acidimicrobiales bacterium]